MWITIVVVLTRSDKMYLSSIKKFKIMPTPKIVIIALFVLAVILGVVVFTKKGQKASPTDNVSNTATDETKQDEEVPINTQFDKSLSEDEKTLLYSASPDYQLATKLAVAAAEVAIENCTAKPTILKVKYGSEITVKNNGSSDFKFGVDPDKNTTIPAGKSAAVKIDFKNGAGLYGYGCNNPEVRRSVGLIWATD